MQPANTILSSFATNALGAGSIKLSESGQSQVEELVSPFLYRSRNVIERMFSRVKDFPRVAMPC